MCFYLSRIRPSTRVDLCSLALFGLQFRFSNGCCRASIVGVAFFRLSDRHAVPGGRDSSFLLLLKTPDTVGAGDAALSRWLSPHARAHTTSKALCRDIRCCTFRGDLLGAERKMLRATSRSAVPPTHLHTHTPNTNCDSVRCRSRELGGALAGDAQPHTLRVLKVQHSPTPPYVQAAATCGHYHTTCQQYGATEVDSGPTRHASPAPFRPSDVLALLLPCAKKRVMPFSVPILQLNRPTRAQYTRR